MAGREGSGSEGHRNCRWRAVQPIFRQPAGVATAEAGVINGRLVLQLCEPGAVAALPAFNDRTGMRTIHVSLRE